MTSTVRGVLSCAAKKNLRLWATNDKSKFPTSLGHKKWRTKRCLHAKILLLPMQGFHCKARAPFQDAQACIPHRCSRPAVSQTDNQELSRTLCNTAMAFIPKPKLRNVDVTSRLHVAQPSVFQPFKQVGNQTGSQQSWVVYCRRFPPSSLCMCECIIKLYMQTLRDIPNKHTHTHSHQTQTYTTFIPT